MTARLGPANALQTSGFLSCCGFISKTYQLSFAWSRVCFSSHLFVPCGILYTDPTTISVCPDVVCDGRLQERKVEDEDAKG